jgi:hypothetical protein
LAPDLDPNDVIGRCRSLVSICRASGQCHEDLQATIAEGNVSKFFSEGKQLRSVELLHDVNVRWSSTYLMIDHILELYLVCPNYHVFCIGFSVC